MFEKWLGATIAGPLAGTFAVPIARSRKMMIAIGERIVRTAS